MTKEQMVLDQANRLFLQRPSWVTFFRQILGSDGIIHQTFSSSEFEDFFHSEEYAQIQHMLARLRKEEVVPKTEPEPTCVVTVRMPKSLHTLLKTEAHNRRTSMNKLCISKLAAPAPDL